MSEREIIVKNIKKISKMDKRKENYQKRPIAKNCRIRN
jgi:hypothetical protein